jgi:hypothetical protein
MTHEQLKTIANESWLGRLRIFKPKKNEKLGIPYKAWHHLAFIDDFVFTYIWDTRELIDCYRLGDMTPEFDTIKISDSGKALFIGANTSKFAESTAKSLLSR